MADSEMQIVEENEELEAENDSDSDSKGNRKIEEIEESDSENDSDSDNEEEEKRKIEELQKQISKDPYQYDTHIDLIKLLKQLGELDQLRDARLRMSKLFPLTEDLWLDWLRDETPLVSDDTERKKIEDLFEKAVEDYLSVNIWLEYVQFSIGGMAAQDGIIRIREVFEKALTSAGIHVTQGSSIWEAYREFENAILLGIMPAPGQVATKQQEDDFSTQHKRILNLFKRQLSVPLNDMEETYIEFQEWLQEEVDSQIKQLYQKALEKYNSIKPFEQDLLTAENKTEVYMSYINHEISHGNASRVICLFERAIKEICLDPEIWVKYTNYLNTTLKDYTLSIPVFERSVRNCPWSPQLWSDYMLTLERANKSHNTMKDIMDRALLSVTTDFLLIWTTYCDYLRRKVKWDTEHTEDLALFRANIEKAVEHLYTIPESDPFGSLRQFWANIEAKYCKNVTKGRELWNEIMTEGHGNEAAMWLNFYHFERCYGDNKHCRKVLQRALNSVSDWPESIVESYINFEREEGDLQQYEQAVAKCTAQMERIKERRQLAAEKEEEQKQQRFGRKTKNKNSFEKGDNSNQNNKRHVKTSKHVDNIEPYQKTERKADDKKHSTTLEDNSQTLKRKLDDTNPEQKFKVPPPPGFKRPEGKQPPPGRKQESMEPPAKLQKTEEESHQDIQDTGCREDKSTCTAFISNLAYHIDEEKIKEVFADIGEIVEIRLIKNFKGKSKGYAYVEFKDELCVLEALKLDHTPVEGRPMYVSKCEEKSSRKPQFKFATSMEKNKLFVKGLPFTCTKEELTEIFSKHGKIKDVRLVTYRSGAPKGLAYVEYEDEQTATQAVMKVDGLVIGDHTISVAISNPPQRKLPKKDDDYIPSLGGGKKETEIRGKARTQVSLLPRSVKTLNEQSKNIDSGKSNDDFRKMLLGIK